MNHPINLSPIYFGIIFVSFHSFQHMPNLPVIEFADHLIHFLVEVVAIGF